MTQPCPQAVRAAHAQVEKAREHMKGALQTLRQGGWDETADDLRKLDAQLQVWVQPDGYFAWLQKGDAA